jgi:hypothetical protein
MRLDLNLPDDRELLRDMKRTQRPTPSPSEIPLPAADAFSIHLERHREIAASNSFPDIPRRSRQVKQNPQDITESPSIERQPRRSRSPKHGVGIGVHIRPEEMKVLSEVGRFRVITVRDLADTVYNGNRRALDSDLNYLQKKSLVTLDSVNARRDGRWSKVERIEVVTLTPPAKQLVRQAGELRSDQHIYAGLVKPREVEHDTQIYRAYLKEMERIEQKGGSNPRVQLDFEIKANVQRAIYAEHKAAPERPLDEIKQQVADQSNLSYIDNQIQIPDARIEYELDQGSRTGSSDIEVVTGAYRPAHLRGKAEAGFSLYASSRDRSRLGKEIEDEHHIMHEILEL